MKRILIISICLLIGSYGYGQKLFENEKNVIVKSKIKSKKTRKRYKIKNSNSNRFLIYEKDTVYIDYELKPICEDTLNKHFAERIYVTDMGLHFTDFHCKIAFLINKKGNVIRSGILNYCISDYYCNQIYGILEKFDKKFIPAKVNGANVASLLIFELDIYDDDFQNYYYESEKR